jgi:teichuronic acid biosynthesis glycosyltransferase TuaG
MRISIVTPCYNAARFLSETITSVRNQTHTDWEWIIVDDCSTDLSLQILNTYSSQDDRIKVIANNMNEGAAVTRNKAINNVSGDFLAFIDADDIWLPTKLSNQITYMLDRHLAFSFTSYNIVDEQGQFAGQTVDVTSKEIVGYKDMLAKRATIGCSTVMLDLRKTGQVQMPIIRTGQDYGLWLALLKKGHSAHRVPEILTSYRKVSGSISANKVKKAHRQWQIYRQIEQLSVFSSLYYFLNYAFRAVFRK